MKQQTSMMFFGLCIKLGIVLLVVGMILALILSSVDGEGLRIFNSIFQIIQ